MHGAREHRGRLPGLGEKSLERLEQIRGLKQELEAAIQEEAYERAAGIRDELRVLESGSEES